MTSMWRRFTIFAASGVVWLSAALIALAGLTPGLAVAAIAYIVVGSLALAVPTVHGGLRLLALWLVAVGAWVGLAAGTDSGFLLSAFAGLIFGTLSWIPWIGTGYLLLHFFGATSGGKSGSSGRPPFAPRPLENR